MAEKKEPQGTEQAKSEEGPKFYLNGKAVDKAAYLAAAPDAGWNPEYLVENNFYPSISTKKHGEQ